MSNKEKSNDFFGGRPVIPPPPKAGVLTELKELAEIAVTFFGKPVPVNGNRLSAPKQEPRFDENFSFDPIDEEQKTKVEEPTPPNNSELFSLFVNFLKEQGSFFDGFLKQQTSFFEVYDLQQKEFSSLLLEIQKKINDKNTFEEKDFLDSSVSFFDRFKSRFSEEEFIQFKSFICERIPLFFKQIKGFQDGCVDSFHRTVENNRKIVDNMAIALEKQTIAFQMMAKSLEEINRGQQSLSRGMESIVLYVEELREKK